MANITDTAPKGSWRRKVDYNYSGTHSDFGGDTTKTAFGIGQKPLGKFVVGDTAERNLRWTKRKL